MEQVVFVNEEGQPTGRTGPKLESHHGKTERHLAFSCYVFNEKGEILLTQRALSKKVWPGVWTNSVCGHPGPGEEIVDAIKRRLREELGMTAKDFTILLPNYSYITPPYKGIIENEFCPVYAARMETPPKPNSEEVASYKWVSWEEFLEATARDSDDYSMYAATNAILENVEGPTYSWWCKDQLKQLRGLNALNEYTKAIS